MSGKNIITYAANNVFSAAVIVYLAGDTRYAHPYSKFLIHEVYHEENPDKKTAKNYAQGAAELKKLTNIYYKSIADHTNLTIAEIKKLVDKAPQNDFEFGAKDAKKYGVVTHMGLPIIPAIDDDDDITFAFIPEEEEEEELALNVE